MQKNNSDKESSCLSKNSLLEQTTSASFEGHLNSLINFKAKQNKIRTFDMAEEETKSQVESCDYFKDDCGCKHFHNEVKLNNTVLQEINKLLDSLLINQGIIIQSVNPDYAKCMIPSNIPSTPLKTKEDFKKMETFLAANRINYEAVRDLLNSKCNTAVGMLSCPSERNVTGNILSRTISNELAKKISWSGSEDKIKFADTKLCEVVFGAIKLRFPDSFLIDAEAKIKRWFQTANGRKNLMAEK